MARIRTIKPDFFTDEKMAKVSPWARLLFIGLWVHADDDGIMAYSPHRVKVQLFPTDDVDVAALVGELQAIGCVYLFEVDGHNYLGVPNFLKHQRINRPTKSRFPNLPQSQVRKIMREGQTPGSVFRVEHSEYSLSAHGGLTESVSTHVALTERSLTEVEVEVEGKRKGINTPLTEDSLSPHHVPSGTSEDPRDHLEGLNSTAVSRALCSENGWAGKEMILTLKDAIEFQAKQMPEASLEQVGEWLVKSYSGHQTTQRKYAVGVRKFFAEGRYKAAPQSGGDDYFKARIFSDNPATRARAQMEAD